MSDTLPLFCYEVLNTVCLFLIILAIKKLRGVSRKFSCVEESKTMVWLHLGLFSVQNLLFAVFIAIEIVYMRTVSPQILKVADVFHLIAAISEACLQWFLVFIMVKLSKPPKTTNKEAIGKQEDLVLRLRTNEALRQYLNVKHTSKSISDITDAFKAYEEIAKKYELQNRVISGSLEGSGYGRF